MVFLILLVNHLDHRLNQPVFWLFGLSYFDDASPPSVLLLFSYLFGEIRRLSSIRSLNRLLVLELIFFRRICCDSRLGLLNLRSKEVSLFSRPVLSLTNVSWFSFLLGREKMPRWLVLLLKPLAVPPAFLFRSYFACQSFLG